MSKSEIIAELSNLSQSERREVMRALVEMESDLVTLADCDQRANERFQMLDAMEVGDERSPSR